MYKCIVLALALSAGSTPALAQEATGNASSAPSGGDTQELAKQLANPIASFISVPFQENIDFSVGPDEGVKSTLNFQPVVPVELSPNWNVIIRTIVPVIYKHDVIPDSAQFGLGHITQSFFFSPAHSGAII